MKTLLFSLLVLGSLSASAANVCSTVFEAKVSRAEALANSWSTESGFRALLRDQEIMGQVKSVYDRHLETRVYFTATGTPNSRGEIPRIDPDARAVVVFFHGSGTAAGGGVNFTGAMNKLANIGLAGMSFDLPFHAEGPRRDQFADRDFLMKWIDDVLAPARASGKPIYLVGHSFGPEIIGEYLYHNSHAAAGAALLSPVGFNATLRAWEKNETSHMGFGGGDVADNTLGGLWADRVGKKFKWTKSEGKGDPTLENPDLRIEILSGDREEYVPAPVGGKSGLPVGRNTYDVAAAIRPFFRRANIVIEPGVGHMIFGHKDSNGQDIVSRTIFQMLNVDGRREGQMAQELAELRNARPQWVQLEAMLAQNSFFQAWLASTNQTGLAHGLIRTSNNDQAFRLMGQFRKDLSERMKQVKLR